MRSPEHIAAEGRRRPGHRSRLAAQLTSVATRRPTSPRDRPDPGPAGEKVADDVPSRRTPDRRTAGPVRVAEIGDRNRLRPAQRQVLVACRNGGTVTCSWSRPTPGRVELKNMAVPRHGSTAVWAAARAGAVSSPRDRPPRCRGHGRADVGTCALPAGGLRCGRAAGRLHAERIHARIQSTGRVRKGVVRPAIGPTDRAGPATATGPDRDGRPGVGVRSCAATPRAPVFTAARTSPPRAGKRDRAGDSARTQWPQRLGVLPDAVRKKGGSSVMRVTLPGRLTARRMLRGHRQRRAPAWSTVQGKGSAAHGPPHAAG